MTLRNPIQGQLSKRVLIIIFATFLATVSITYWTMASYSRSKAKPNTGVLQFIKQRPDQSHPNDCNCEETATKAIDERYLQAPQFREIATHPPGEQCIKRLPHAIVVGVQKGGTSALLSFLSVHPQIAACMKPAETQYFSAHQRRPLEWYKNLMPCSYSNQVTMEKSPPYFYRGWTARLIRRRMGTNVKIIVIVKDPIVRAESMFAMFQAHKKKMVNERFADHVVVNGTVKTGSMLIRFSNYPYYMPAWLEVFPRRNILIVDGHNLEKNPDKELNIVEDFLGIGTYFTPDKFVFNETKGKYCLAMDEGTDCLSEKKGRKHQSYSDDVKKILQDYFRPLNEQFFSQINRRFDWGY